MLLVIAALICVASVPLAGGHLGALSVLRLRAIWAVLASAAIQVLITQAPGGSHALHVALHVLSYVLVVVFLVANRVLPGMRLLTAGVVANMAAIGSNGGVMPASAWALRVAGIDPGAGFANSAALRHPNLLALGDVIPVPGPWPIGNVLSVGDLAIFAGALVLLHYTTASRIARARVRRREWNARSQSSSTSTAR